MDTNNAGILKDAIMIRKAKIEDLSRIAEIYVLNDRINNFPIFKDEEYCFNYLTVMSVINDYFMKPEILNNLYVIEDNITRGFMVIIGNELDKLYADPGFLSE